MDEGLVRWARAVKARGQSKIPVLWYFTDAARMADPLPVVRALPRGLCGVVFRHDGVAGREMLGRQVAKLCRARRIALVVAGDARLAAALHAGVHLRGGRRDGYVTGGCGVVTASAHNVVEVRRAVRAGVVFISPVFETASHPGGRVLGPLRWNVLARHAGAAEAYALGGINGKKINRLAKYCRGAASISAFT
jgi:thiamine-phosphate pyrophosphorylase